MKKKVRGFTLIELMVVIAIITVLSAITVPNVIRQIRSNRVNEANTKAQQLYSATADYMVTLQRQGKIAKEYFDPTTSYATTTNDIFFFGFNPVFLDGSHTEAQAYQVSNGSSFLHIPGAANSANLTATKIGIIKNLSGSASGARTGSGGTGWWTEGAWIVAVNVNTYSVVGAWYYPNPKNGNGSVNYSFDSFGCVKQCAGAAYASITAQDQDINSHAAASGQKQFTGQYPIDASVPNTVTSKVHFNT